MKTSEKNIGKIVTIKVDEKTSFKAKITAVANERNYFALILNHPNKSWPWMIRADILKS